MTARPSQMLKLLDLSMLILIFIGSFMVIFDENTHFIPILAFMFVFLGYFIGFRYDVYFGGKKKKYMTIHELPGRTPPPTSQRKNRFTEQYEQRQIQKSKLDIMQKNNDDSLNNSNISYMNRSKKANQSMSKSHISNSSIHNGDFNFLNQNKSGNVLLRESFVRGNRGMDDSYIRNFTSNEQREEDIRKEVNKNMNECTARYIKTLQKLRHTPTSALATIKKIRELSLILCKEFYKQNIQNLKNFIELLIQIYDIKINCKQVAELEQLLRFFPQRKQQKLEISLSDILKKIGKSDKFDEIGIPLRNKNKQGFSSFRTMNNNDRLVQRALEETIVISEQNKKKLKKLLSEREKLSSYFYDQNIVYLTPEQLLTKIQTLKQHIEEQQSEQSQYQLVNNTKISEEYSERLMIGFNISKNKLNQIVKIPEYQLQYRKKSYFGWLRLNNPNIYQIKQTLNSDNGHPHYDILYGKQNKQQYGCQYGKNNGYCMIWVYLSLMQANNVEVIRGNKKLENIYSRYLGIIVL